MRFRETEFRPLFGRIAAIVVGLLGAAAIAAALVAGEFETALRSLGLVGFVVVATFAAFWFPRVGVREDEIEVRNVFSTSHVPWGAIRRIDTKWALALETDRGTVTAWASPAPGRYASLGMSRRDVSGATDSARAAQGSIRPGDALSTESGAVAHVIRTHWEQLRDDGLLDAPQAGTGPRREWHVATIAACAVTAVAAVLGVAL